QAGRSGDLQRPHPGTDAAGPAPGRTARGEGNAGDGMAGTGRPTGGLGMLTPEPSLQLWLPADPAWVRPDMNGVRLLACGQLQLSMDEAQAFAAMLRPVFDEAGMQLEISTPDRWHLRLPADMPLPDFDAPEQALG